ncbi:MAG TPA: type II secretion system F family protein [Vicinamibacterales bacterium]|nr:type II secretion system F family protein [Vicinamibacterales bacterium]
MTVLLPLLAFLFVALLVGAAAMALAPAGGGVIQRRLGELRGIPGMPIDEPSAYGETAKRTFKRLGRYAPTSVSETSKLRARLVCAGYRGSEALPVFVGIRFGCALLAFGVMSTPIFFRPNVLLALGAAALGYLLPGMALGRMAKKRQHRIRLSLADALDLMVVSVEAGLGMDQALQRVGEELAFAHKDLSDELRLVNLELRAGKARSEALRNLADRTGVDDLSSLAAMLIQTDKFGTSVAQSLRVHSETLRTKRRQRAEEAAAKTGVKMVFPLVFCIFPAIWVVTIGPAAIKFVQVLFPMMQQK